MFGFQQNHNFGIQSNHPVDSTVSTTKASRLLKVLIWKRIGICWMISARFCRQTLSTESVDRLEDTAVATAPRANKCCHDSSKVKAWWNLIIYHLLPFWAKLAEVWPQLTFCWYYWYHWYYQDSREYWCVQVLDSEISSWRLVLPMRTSAQQEFVTKWTNDFCWGGISKNKKCLCTINNAER